jgi:uncharacterized protein (TIGR02246 family)
MIGRISAASARAGDHRQAIDDIFRKFAEAYGRNDAEAIAAPFTEDGILSTPGGPILVGRQAVAQNYKGRSEQGYGNISFQLQHYDPDGAWAAGGYTVSLPRARASARATSPASSADRPTLC